MSRFRQPILEEVKFTTIREKPWPIGVPIMAYEWLGTPYRSKQAEICPVIAEKTTLIEIWTCVKGEAITFTPAKKIHGDVPLWKCEGFHDEREMKDHFLSKLGPDQKVTMHLIRFRRLIKV